MPNDETHDYRCLVTLLVEDVTEAEAVRLFTSGTELEEASPDGTGLIVSIEEAGHVQGTRP